MRSSRTLLAAGAAGSCLALWAAVPMVGGAAPSKAELDKKISSTRSKVEQRKGTERVLTKDIRRYSERIGSLESRIQGLERRQSELEQDLSARRAELVKTQDELRSERARLVRLQQRYREVRRTLEDRVVQIYKEGRPDLLSVVLEADGFQQLIERGEFVGRLAEKDRQIISIVRSAKQDATKTEKRLDSLEERQKRVTATVERRRDTVARVRQGVASAQDELQSVRSSKRSKLQSVREDRHELEGDLEKMERASARIAAQLRASAAGPGAVSAGPIKKGTGRFIYPMDGTFTSPFGSRWGRLHAGIDIAAPIGTPIRAADSGTVVIAGTVSGYGNYTCIQHGNGMSTCYGHQSRIGVSVGQRVSQGQVIGACGNTGRSTGPHLHFEVRVNGTPQNPMGYL